MKIRIDEQSLTIEGVICDVHKGVDTITFDVCDIDDVDYDGHAREGVHIIQIVTTYQTQMYTTPVEGEQYN